MIVRASKTLLVIILSIAAGWYAHVLWTFDPHNGIQFQLNDAARRGDIRSIERLVHHGARPTGRAIAEGGSIDGGSAIAAAAHAGESEAVAWFLDHGADPNQIDIDMTALELARHRLFTTKKSIEILLQRGAKEQQ